MQKYTTAQFLLFGSLHSSIFLFVLIFFSPLSLLLLSLLLLFLGVEVQRYRANLLTWGLLDRGREATQRSALDRAPPSSRTWLLELKNGPGLGVRIPPVPGSGLAHMDGGKVLIHMGSPPLGPLALTTTKTSENFFFFGERKTLLPMFTYIDRSIIALLFLGF